MDKVRYIFPDGQIYPYIQYSFIYIFIYGFYTYMSSLWQYEVLKKVSNNQDARGPLECRGKFFQALLKNITPTQTQTTYPYIQYCLRHFSSHWKPTFSLNGHGFQNMGI